jgi:hypothetical protein
MKYPTPIEVAEMMVVRHQIFTEVFCPDCGKTIHITSHFASAFDMHIESYEGDGELEKTRREFSEFIREQRRIGAEEATERLRFEKART